MSPNLFQHSFAYRRNRPMLATRLISLDKLGPVAEELHDAAGKLRKLRQSVQAHPMPHTLAAVQAIEEDVIVALGRLKAAGVPVPQLPQA